MRRLPLLLLALEATAATAQPDLRPPAAAPSVSLDVAYALGDAAHAVSIGPLGNDTTEIDIAMTSLAILTSARIPLVGRWTVVVELPVSVSRVDQTVTGDRSGLESGTNTRAELGNIAVGVEAQVSDALRLGGGLRLPTTTRGGYAGTGGVLADPTYAGLAADQEHPEAYVSNLLALAASADLVAPVTPLLGLRLRLAPALLLNTEDGGRTDVVLSYGAHADVEMGPAQLSVGGVGRQYGRDDVGLGGLYESDLALVLGGRVEVGGVRPGLTARIPLVERYQFAEAAVGVSLDVPIR